MTRALAALGLGLVALTGCPSNDGGNPPVLWLAPDMLEIHVKLVESEPPPF